MLQRRAMDQSITLRTLADLAIRQRYTLTAHCQNRLCLHVQQLDLADLIERLGADFEYMKLGRRCRCTECGSVGAQVMLGYSV